MIEQEPHHLFDEAMTRLAEGDLRGARRLMKAAADEGIEPAVSLFASFVEYGVGGHPSERKALPWYEKAARLGVTSAIVRLVRWHLTHNQLPQAKYWLSRASQDPRALLTLVGMLETNRSVRATISAKRALTRIGIDRNRLTLKRERNMRG